VTYRSNPNDHSYLYDLVMNHYEVEGRHGRNHRSRLLITIIFYFYPIFEDKSFPYFYPPSNSISYDYPLKYSSAYSNPQDRHCRVLIASDSTPSHFYNQPLHHLRHRARSTDLMSFVCCCCRLEDTMGFCSSSLWRASGSSGRLRSAPRFTRASGGFENGL